MPEDSWAEATEARLNVKAARTLRARVVPSRNPTEIRLSGTCPRCGHEMLFIYPLVIAAPWAEPDVAADLALDYFRPRPPDLLQGDREVNAYCTCATEHPKTPKDREGCGARFVVNVKWGR